MTEQNLVSSAMNLFESAARQRKVTGGDAMEFAYDFAAALLTYKLTGIVHTAR